MGELPYRAVPKADGIASWPTQTPAARRLGVTVKRLEQLVRTGELVSARDFFGRVRYDPAPIEQLRSRIHAGFKQATKAPAAGGAAGKAQARAFKLFAEGKPSREIVIETELAPSVVQDLRRQYAEMGGDLLISSPVLEDLRDVLDWRGAATERALLLAVRTSKRASFERGLAAAAVPPNHINEGESSGESHTGSGGKGRGSQATGEGALRLDPRGETDE